MATTNSRIQSRHRNKTTSLICFLPLMQYQAILALCHSVHISQILAFWAVMGNNEIFYFRLALMLQKWLAILLQSTLLKEHWFISGSSGDNAVPVRSYHSWALLRLFPCGIRYTMVSHLLVLSFQDDTYRIIKWFSSERTLWIIYLQLPCPTFY